MRYGNKHWANGNEIGNGRQHTHYFVVLQYIIYGQDWRYKESTALGTYYM